MTAASDRSEEIAARRKPLILRALSRMAIGGVQRGILATLSRADRERFDYHVLCTKKEGNWASALRELGIPLTAQKTLPPWDPYQILRLARVIREIRPDIIHIHMAPTVIPVATAARMAGVRHFIVHHHNDYARHWNEQNIGLRRWEFMMTRKADAIVAVSQAVARCTEEHLVLEPGTVEVIPNGLERAKFEKATPHDPRPEWGIEPGRPLVVHVARYLPTKRIEDFIEAAATISRRWPERYPALSRPAFACIGGGGDPSLGEAYRRLIVARKLEGTVILAGSRNDIPAILPTAQVGALASEMEGFGQVVLEYVAAGLPVAATNLDCIAEMLRDGREALLSPPRRPEALAAHIERLLTEPELGHGLVEAGRQRLELFDWGRAEREYERIYCRILGLRTS